MTPPAEGTDSVADEIRGLEERLTQGWVRRSRDELEKLLAEEFVEFGSSGRIHDRASIVATLATQPEFAIELADFRLATLAPDCALMTYVATVRRPAEGRSSRSLRSSIWRRTGGRWRVVFHQGTPMPG